VHIIHITNDQQLSRSRTAHNERSRFRCERRHGTEMPAYVTPMELAGEMKAQAHRHRPERLAAATSLNHSKVLPPVQGVSFDIE
jgi:hypothetical protein